MSTYSKKQLQTLFPLTKESIINKHLHTNLPLNEWTKKITQVLDQNNIKTYLIYGACLGAVRNKALIKHDHDIDMAIHSKDLKKLATNIIHLEKDGFKITKVTRASIIIRMPNINISFDIYPIYKVKNISYCLLGYKWLLNDALIRDNYFDNAHTIQFEGGKFYLPNPSEKYCKDVYGKDWQIPKKGVNCAPRAFLSQCLNYFFVDFEVPIKYSNFRQTGTFKPWFSYIILKFFPNSKFTNLFKHPNLDA